MPITTPHLQERRLREEVWDDAKVDLEDVEEGKVRCARCREVV